MRDQPCFTEPDLKQDLISLCEKEDIVSPEMIKDLCNKVYERKGEARKHRLAEEINVILDSYNPNN